MALSGPHLVEYQALVNAPAGVSKPLKDRAIQLRKAVVSLLTTTPNDLNDIKALIDKFSFVPNAVPHQVQVIPQNPYTVQYDNDFQTFQQDVNALLVRSNSAGLANGPVLKRLIWELLLAQRAANEPYDAKFMSALAALQILNQSAAALDSKSCVALQNLQMSADS